MSGLQILSTGRCLPQRVVTNAELAQRMDTSDGWIFTRTGIRERRFCDTETNSDLAEGAARQALERAGITADQIGLCVVATLTADMACPSTACVLQQRLGLPEDCPCFDINAACSGFLYGLKVVSAMLEDANHPYALLVGCEVLSRMMDHDERSTAVLFGDGAGAAVLRLSSAHRFHSVLGARGNGEILNVNGYASQRRAIFMDGQAVFRFAVEAIQTCVSGVLDRVGLTLREIDLVVCHQANARIIDHVVKRLNAEPARFYKNMDRYGNTSSASIPMALDELNEAGRLTPGTKLLCVGFGGGLTWGGAFLEW